MINKLKYIKEVFEKHKYHLKENDTKDLEVQLKRKPITLYLMAIDFLNNYNVAITYPHVQNLIKINIRIRNIIRELISALEEAVRVEYLDKNLTDIANYDEYQKFLRKSFTKIIKDLNLKDKFNSIRWIRNNVSHLSYPLIYQDLEKIIKKLKSLKTLNFVENQTIDLCLRKIAKANDNLKIPNITKILSNFCH